MKPSQVANELRRIAALTNSKPNRSMVVSKLRNIISALDDGSKTEIKAPHVPITRTSYDGQYLEDLSIDDLRRLIHEIKLVKEELIMQEGSYDSYLENLYDVLNDLENTSGLPHSFWFHPK